MSAPKLMSLLAVLVYFTPVAHAVVTDCATNCKTCWSSSASQCMSCDDLYFMQSFECREEATESCDAGWTLDDRDKICKRTINDIDNPCEPGTYN